MESHPFISTYIRILLHVYTSIDRMEYAYYDSLFTLLFLIHLFFPHYINNTIYPI